MLLRSSHVASVDIWSQVISDTAFRNRYRESSSGVFIGRLSRLDDYPTLDAFDSYSDGWLRVLKTLGNEGSRKQAAKSTQLPVVDRNNLGEKSSTAEGKIRPSYSIDDYDDYDDEKRNKHYSAEEVRHEQFSVKKSRGTMRREVHTILREIRDQINSGEKNGALIMYSKRAEEHNFNALEMNFVATKVMGDIYIVLSIPMQQRSVLMMRKT